MRFESGAHATADAWCRYTRLEERAMTFNESQTQEALAHGRRRAVVTGLRAKNGTEYPLAIHPRRWVIGSGPNCDVVIDDPYVSATHCVLERRAGGTMH